ncbi:MULTISPECIES: AAA family ATPase [Sphingobacterium]|uniref:AAA family ATPase n=1 Tax=Sphingobacterium TaxID=28453 RepID=UPI0025809370|nr:MULTISPECIES: AAA family ATPase [Sphingobacterium]
MLKKKSLKEYLNDIDVWHTWRDNYKNFVPKFVEEAKRGLDWSEWDNNIFYEFFERSNGQCVSSLRQGYFTSEEKLSIKNNWNELSPILKLIAESVGSAPHDEYNKLKKIIRKYTNQDRRAATNRLIASIQPQFLCTIVNHNNLNTLISYLNAKVLNADLRIKDNWFESSNEVLNFFLKEGEFDDAYDMITYPWQLFEYFNDSNPVENNDMSEKKVSDEIVNLLKFKKQIILQGPPGTGKTRVAKLLAKELIGGDSSIDLIPETIDEAIIKEKCIHGTEISSARDGVKYSIRGINAIGVEVIATSGNPYTPKYSEIIDMYQTRAWDKEGNLRGGNDSYSAAVAKYIYKIFEKDFKRNFFKQYKLLQFHPSYSYEDFVRGIVSKPNEAGDGIIYEAENKNLAEFAEIALENWKLASKVTNPTDSKVELQNFVLIIDEINRANLSSVLGELIYALEYRGETVASMYAINDDNKLILPPNLYIIGTMNTADRSVGHIDYAIRRRFAFVDILPKDLSEEEGIIFDTELFNRVSQLFDTNLSSEFEKKEVQLGHSYFIDKSEEGGSMFIRLEYEIKPILLEYVKDGVLVGEGIQQAIQDLKPSM